MGRCRNIAWGCSLLVSVALGQGAHGGDDTGLLWTLPVVNAGDWHADDLNAPWATDATGSAPAMGESGAAQGVKIVFDAARGRGKATLGHEFPEGIPNSASATHFTVKVDSDAALAVSMSAFDRDGRYFALPSVAIPAGRDQVALVPITMPPAAREFITRTKINVTGYSPNSTVVIREIGLLKREGASSEVRRPKLSADIAPGIANVALKQPGTASSIESSEHPAAAAFDGDLSTRWASAPKDGEWLAVDLGEEKEFNTVVLHWETAFAREYAIEGSGDGEQWTKIFETAEGMGGVETTVFPPARARHLRLVGSKRGTTFGTSIYEMKVGINAGAKPGVTRGGDGPIPIHAVVNFRAGEGLPAEASTSFVNVAGLVGAAAEVRRPLVVQLEAAATYSNPYDPSEVSIDAEFTSPTGKKVTVPAFYYRPFERKTVEGQEQLSGGQGAQWRVKFTPEEAGEWQCVARMQHSGGAAESSQYAFKVAEGDAAGFVRIAASNPRYFQRDNGSLYFPIGLNFAWPPTDRGNLQTLEYDRCLEELAANGGNFIRIWLCSWAFSPEWTDTGLGNYDARQPQLWRLDHIMQRCDELGIGVMLCISNHGMFSSKTNPEWNANPYNAANGGPCAVPKDFLTDEEARKFFRQKLRYLAARYAAHPSLFAWEWFNEMEYAEGFVSPEFGDWSAEMADYLHSLDPHHHPITTSSTSVGSPLMWDLPSIEFTQNHAYGSANWTPMIEAASRSMTAQWQKPFLMGEFGMSAEGNGMNDGGWSLHNGNWASFFSGASGGAMTWWWDSMVFAPGSTLSSRYKGLAGFLEGESPHRGAASFESTRFVTAEGVALEARFVRTDGADFLWLRREDASEVAASLKHAAGEWWQPLGGVHVELPQGAGAGSIEWWDTETGNVVSRQAFDSRPAKVEAPPFAADIAAKIRCNGKPADEIAGPTGKEEEPG